MAPFDFQAALEIAMLLVKALTKTKTGQIRFCRCEKGSILVADDTETTKMDRLDPQSRSENMRRIRSKDTAPELLVRRLIYSLGYRYRLHGKELPGKPDIVLRPRKSVIFVHGCFWHLHGNCREGRIPSTRQEYWIPKLGRNTERDREHMRQLKKAGWRVLVIWECEVDASEKLTRKLVRFLSSAPKLEML